MPGICSSRTRPAPRGGCTLMVLTSSGRASSSSSVIHTVSVATARAMSALVSRFDLRGVEQAHVDVEIEARLLRRDVAARDRAPPRRTTSRAAPCAGASARSGVSQSISSASASPTSGGGAPGAARAARCRSRRPCACRRPRSARRRRAAARPCRPPGRRPADRRSCGRARFRARSRRPRARWRSSSRRHRGRAVGSHLKSVPKLQHEGHEATKKGTINVVLRGFELEPYLKNPAGRG